MEMCIGVIHEATSVDLAARARVVEVACRHGWAVLLVFPWAFDRESVALFDPPSERARVRAFMDATVADWRQAYPAVPIEAALEAGSADDVVTRASRRCAVVVVPRHLVVDPRFWAEGPGAEPICGPLLVV